MGNSCSPYVEVVIPCYRPRAEFAKVLAGIFSQDYSNFRVIVINDSPDVDIFKRFRLKDKKNLELVKNKKNLGIAATLNKWIKKSDAEFIVTLLQDTIPVGEEWLNNLVNAAVKNNALACTSLVEYPKVCLRKSDSLIRPLIKNTVGISQHGLDSKGSIYKKSALKQVGFFDSSHFRTAGEDFDIDKKLRKIGTVFNSDSIVIHYHVFSREAFAYTHSLYGNAFGVLFRLYKFNIVGSFGGLFRAVFPFWAIKKCLFLLSKKELRWAHFPYLIKCNWSYSKQFWRSFALGKQK